MKENAITIRECAPRIQNQSFCAILNLDGTTRLHLTNEDETQEVSGARVECEWNSQPNVPESNREAYILACLPVFLTIVYFALSDLLHLW